jgi:hypothetical protein
MKQKMIPILAILVFVAGIPTGVMPAELDCNAQDYTSEQGTLPGTYWGLVTVEGLPASLGTEIELFVDGVPIGTILTGAKWRCSYPGGCELAKNNEGNVMCVDSDTYVVFLLGNDDWGDIQFVINNHSVGEHHFAKGGSFQVDLHNPTGPVVTDEIANMGSN